jgi:hypothetical protein
MNFAMTVQGTFYKNITAANTLLALQQLIADRDAGLIPGYVVGQPDNIVINNIT